MGRPWGIVDNGRSHHRAECQLLHSFLLGVHKNTHLASDNKNIWLIDSFHSLFSSHIMITDSSRFGISISYIYIKSYLFEIEYIRRGEVCL